jgi:hypothetical protein
MWLVLCCDVFILCYNVPGKERVFMSVAKMLNKKVYVEKAKWKMMVSEVNALCTSYVRDYHLCINQPPPLPSQLCFDWCPEELGRLTFADPNSTNIWVVPMNHINFKSLGACARLDCLVFLCMCVLLSYTPACFLHPMI